MSLNIEVETPRLVLRQWRAADRKPFAALNADPQVTQFLLPMTPQESDALADRLAAGIDEHGWGFWAVEAPGVAPFIGFVGIKPLAPTLPFAPGVEIGWRLAQPFWGRGYASEAADAALRVGFEQVGAEEIVAFTATDNVRSRAVMDRLGMAAEPGCFDHPAVPAGHPLRAHVLYRLGREAWRRRRQAGGANDGAIFAAA
ncbi:GNAT family N-acetyltransferase [Achromobacter sp. UBA4530]|uniref:GNAT family N-acetyltransferase n=1 Tax=Achromobacter sp. UBA4530 TaxID=1945912 RepID=UPI00257FFA22|nr:GNAT family N-acetyltransferase [Achromobacter sp. UBA4530]